MIAYLAIFVLAVVSYPAGDHPIDQTISLPYVQGGTVSGVGDGQYVKNSTMRGEQSVLIPALGVTSTMKLTGTHWTIERLTFSNQTLPGAGIGLLVTNKQPTGAHGLGAGKHTLNRLTFEHYGIGIQFGEELKTNNCDSVQANKLWFNRCDTCVNTVNQMGMTNEFHDTSANGCVDIFRFEAGGKWLIDGVFAGYTREDKPDGAVLRLVGNGRLNNKGERIEQGIGNNNNNFIVRNVNMDTQVGSRLALVRIDEHFTHPSKVKIDGGMIAYDYYWQDRKHQVITRNPADITIRDYVGLQTGAFADDYKAGKAHTRYLIENCVIAGGDVNGDGRFDGVDLLDPGHSDATNIWLTVRDCKTPNGETIPPTYLRPMSKELQ
jgi:hypothetical protein